MTRQDVTERRLHAGIDEGSITYPSITTECAMRITTKGQVTIPIAVRERLGLFPNTEVEFYIRGDTAVLTKAGKPNRGKDIVDALRRNPGTVQMTTDEIMALTRDYDER